MYSCCDKEKDHLLRVVDGSIERSGRKHFNVVFGVHAITSFF